MVDRTKLVKLAVVSSARLSGPVTTLAPLDFAASNIIWRCSFANPVTLLRKRHRWFYYHHHSSRRRKIDRLTASEFAPYLHELGGEFDRYQIADEIKLFLQSFLAESASIYVPKQCRQPVPSSILPRIIHIARGARYYAREDVVLDVHRRKPNGAGDAWCW